MDEPLTYDHLIAEASPGVVLARLDGVLRGPVQRHVSHALLAAVRKMHAQTVLLDLTGAEGLADEEINTLVNLATAIGLLGAKAVLIGVSGPLSLKLQMSSFEVGALVNARELRASLRS